ncbi:MAG TPA: hypothetical protein VFH51_11235 [Myxococcota bacterium]|nr:hypothetical protein [Myxococcota bacterium]
MIKGRAAIAGLLLAVGLVSAPNRAVACASCGAGGDDALILAPSETWKASVSMARTGDFIYVKPDGRAGTAVSPVARDAFTVAMARAMGPRAFVTVTAPTVRNVGDTDERWGVGDPSLGLRYTLVPQAFTDPWLPQVQVVAGFRYALGRSVNEAVDPGLLDVFGTGHSEVRAGLDLWWGMFDWKLGTAQQLLAPLARAIGQVETRPGYGLRSTVTAGYGRDGWGRVVAGLVREQAGEQQLDGAAVSGSRRLLHTVFATADAEVTEADTLRLTAARAGVLGSFNTSRTSAFSLTYMRAW